MTAYRDDVDALAARHQALAAELAHKTREVAAAAELLEEARVRARLPVLDNLRVASPCTADWNQMTGDARVRACDSCQKNVYNLSEMTRDQAEALLVEKEGKLCVRYFQRKDGTILFKDCAVGISRKRRRRFIAAGAATLLAGGALYAFEWLRNTSAVCHSDPRLLSSEPELVDLPPQPEPARPPPPATEEVYVVMGDLAAPEPPAPTTPPPGSPASPAAER